MIAGDVAPAAGTPTWLIALGLVMTMLGASGGAIVVKLLDRRKARVETDEVFTKIAVSLVEPLRARLEHAEKVLAAEQERAVRRENEADRMLSELRARVRSAMDEADQAYQSAYRWRRLLLQWHRAIMDPSATLEWLRQLVGPDEPAI